MREALRAAALFLVGVLLLLAGAILVAGPAPVRWKAEYAELPQATRDWYRTRELTPAAQKRFAFKSCCDNSDVVRAKFAVSKLNGTDQWFYQLPGEEKWQQVPDDVIHWDEHAPSGEPVMFVFAGHPTCFYPPSGGI